MSQPPTQTLIGIYLNDHLAQATAGLELFRRAASSTRGTDVGRALAVITGEVAEDRDSLLAIMRALGVPVRSYKVALGWVAEKAGRLKLNGRLVGRSPLSTLVELEGLRVGVEGKLQCWNALINFANTDDRLDVDRLHELVARGRRQADRLTELHRASVAGAFAAGA